MAVVAVAALPPSLFLLISGSGDATAQPRQLGRDRRGASLLCRPPRREEGGDQGGGRGREIPRHPHRDGRQRRGCRWPPEQFRQEVPAARYGRHRRHLGRVRPRRADRDGAQDAHPGPACGQPPRPWPGLQLRGSGSLSRIIIFVEIYKNLKIGNGRRSEECILYFVIYNLSSHVNLLGMDKV